MKWARLDEKRVVEVTTVSPEGRFHPNIEWVICPDNVSEGFIFLEGIFLQDSIFVDKSANERLWRNQQLLVADYELNKVQDSDAQAVGSVTQWRDYRKALRAWPEHEDFPDESKRPVSPLVK